MIAKPYPESNVGMQFAVRVKDGKISGVALLTGSASQANLSTAAALKFGLKTIMDYGDLVISPGLIDTHVHFNEPGREAWEGGLLDLKDVIGLKRSLKEDVFASQKAVNVIGAIFL